MDISQIKKDAAGQLKEHNGEFPKLVLSHTAVTVGASIVLMLVNLLFRSAVPQSGLQYMDTRILLSTIETVLRLAVAVLVPFWEAGLIYAGLRLIHGRKLTFSDLGEGLRCWVPLLISMLVRGVLYFLILTACSSVSSVLLSLLPLPPSVYEDALAFMENPAFPLSGSMLLLTVIYAVLYVITLGIVLIPTLYLHRLVVYQIMDDEPCGGLQAVVQSRLLMRGNRRKLFLLDLSYWWFYALELLLSVLSMGDLILSELGISLPMGPDAAAWVFSIGALLAQLVLYRLAKPRMAVSYCLFYRAACNRVDAEPEPKKQKPVRMPWKYE